MNAAAIASEAQTASVTLRSLMHAGIETIDPRSHPAETFDYYCAPAFGSGRPDVVQGSALGARVQLVEAADVLLSRTVAQPRRAWVVGTQRGRRQIASIDWLVLRSPQTDPGYLLHLLTSNGFHLRFMAAVGAHGKSSRARPNQLGTIRIPSPPLAQQGRIAQVLDEANGLRGKRRAMLETLAQLPRALFHDLFGVPMLDTPRFAPASIAAISVAAPTVGKALPESDHGSVLLLGARCIRAQSIDLGQAKRVELVGETGHALADGDLLLVRALEGQIERAEGAIVYPGEARCTFDSSTLRLRFDRERAEPEFVLYFLDSAHGRALLARAARGPKVRSRIDPGVLAGLSVPLPPIELQRDFTRRLAALGPLELAARKSAVALDALIGALRDHAYTGELQLV